MDYFKTLQETISKADNSLESVNTPAIQINQQQINIGTESAELTRESRDKVKKIIDQILADSKGNIENEWGLNDVSLYKIIKESHICGSFLYLIQLKLKIVRITNGCKFK